MEFEKVREYILAKLQNELPPILYYHSFNHVMDVYSAAENLADLEGIEGENLVLLRTAVLFHDSGFTVQLNNHEMVGCGIVRNQLPKYGYNSVQIEKICGMIMATKIPQTPHNLLEQIICDADLDYIGRDDFWEIGGKLFLELKALEILKTELDWNRLQISFLSAHQYFTNGARNLRQKKKLEHLKELYKIVDSLN
ncbi:MAG: HD domain-containing protein [bacterium]|nr:HD domain-containing protein [bacterium]